MTEPLLALLVSLAGGAGAACRLMVDGTLRTRVASAVPAGTMVINLTGSLLLGLVVGLAGAHVLPEAWRQVLGTGFLGGYTTFSTASLETVRLLAQRRVAAALVNGLGMLLAGVAAATLGLLLGAAL